MDWFLYDRDIRYEIVNTNLAFTLGFTCFLSLDFKALLFDITVTSRLPPTVDE